VDSNDDEARALKKAGADALDFNAPLGTARADLLIDTLASRQPSSAVDLGCGRGELARRLADRSMSMSVVGVDIDPELVRVATELTRSSGLSDRVRFETANAASWSGDVDAAACVGASHVFGGTAAMMSRLAALVPRGAALIGDGVWESPPDAWCLEVFGYQPSGLAGLIEEAVRAGWTIDYADLSTPSEWDDFENTWTDSVRAVATPAALAFADSRQADYGKYRSVLGFGWLQLHR
jgi:SAM-dependent methyltransferase